MESTKKPQAKAEDSIYGYRSTSIDPRLHALLQFSSCDTYSHKRKRNSKFGGKKQNKTVQSPKPVETKIATWHQIEQIFREYQYFKKGLGMENFVFVF